MNIFSILLTFSQAITPMALINWQIGDYQEYKVSSSFGDLGTGLKIVDREDTAQGAVWLHNEISLMGQQQVTDTLIRRSDAKVLKTIVNGQEQAPDEDAQIDIIEQTETEITVPAGTFDCMYTKAKITTQGQTAEIELYSNPRDVNIDGMLKMNINSGMMPFSLELTKFGRR